MGKQSINDGQWPENNKRKQARTEHVNFASNDGLVEVVTTAGKKYPQHDYKVVVLRLRPEPGTRVLRLDDGSSGVEVLLTHVEVVRHLQALNAADPKGGYTWRDIPEKPASRKEFWKRINSARHHRSCR